MAELTEALKVAIEAANAARLLLLAECARPDGPRGTSGHCPADEEAEWLIRNHLLARFPTWGYLGEETGAQPAASGEDHVWVVDPNDGTSSMQRGYRGHAVSIGVVCGGTPVLGVVWAVDAPDDDGELFTWAEGTGPVRRNGLIVEPFTWPQALGAEDIVLLSLGAHRDPVGNLACIAPARFLALPSIAYRLALVAAGEAVATVSLSGACAWDYAAGHALVRGAGGVLVDEAGGAITYARDGQSISRYALGGGAQVVAALVEKPWSRAVGSGFGEAQPPRSLAPVRPRPDHLVHDADILQRAQGCLLGQLAGDALGALVEFAAADEIARRYPDGGPRHLASGGPHRILAGQPTDDSELALLLARTLVAQDGFDQEAVAAAYAGWFQGWTHADIPKQCVHYWCRPFDIGTTTTSALEQISLGDVLQHRAAETAQLHANQHSQANGALMRISPLGIWGAFHDVSQVADAARQDAQLTHPHQVCQDASALFAVTVAAAIRDGSSPRETYDQALAWATTSGLEPTVLAVVEAAATEPPRDFMTKQGWVLIALQNALFQLLHAPTLEAGVVATVRSGGDTDTNAAICGALLGAVHGRSSVPEQWQRMVLTCRPLLGQQGVRQPRPAVYWPTDALTLAERLLTAA